MGKGFIQSFDIRWGDLDPNRHLANTAIMSLMIETRMAYLRSLGYGQQWFADHNIGPAILSETNWYLKEILPDEKVSVDLACMGHTSDLRFWRWRQNLYNQAGTPCAGHEVNFVWFDLLARKIIPAPDELKGSLAEMPRHPQFRLMESAEFRPPESIIATQPLV